MVLGNRGREHILHMGDMGIDTLQERMVAAMPDNRYLKKLFKQEWNFKPRRGRQRKCRSKVIDDLFSSLGLDKEEWLRDIQNCL